MSQTILAKVKSLSAASNFGIATPFDSKGKDIKFPITNPDGTLIVSGLSTKAQLIFEIKDLSPWPAGKGFQATTYQLADPEETQKLESAAIDSISSDNHLKQGNEDVNHHLPGFSESFTYPYNFITPAKPLREKKEFTGLHDRYYPGKHSGTLSCMIKTCAPVFIPDPDQKKWEKVEKNSTDEKVHWKKPFFRLTDDTPAIPGTSLKGMIRSVAEAASNSCFAIFDENRFAYRLNRRKKEYRFSTTDLLKRLGKTITGKEDAFLPCDNSEALCTTCQLFGFISAKGSSKNEGLAGRLAFSEARLISSAGQSKWIPLRILSSPRPKYFPFYLTASTPFGPNDFPLGNYSYQGEQSRIRGRKFYWHHTNFIDKTKTDWETYLSHHPLETGEWLPEEKTLLNLTAEILPPGSSFQFSVRFENLSLEEFGLLLFVIDFNDTQDGKLCHHVGMGKPLGMGTVKVNIDQDKTVIVDRIKRYQSLNESGRYGKEEAEALLKKARDAFNQALVSANNETPFEEITNIRDLMQIVDSTQPPSDGLDIRYRPLNLAPGENFAWFGGGRIKREEWNKHKIYESPHQALPTIKDVLKGKSLEQGTLIE